MPSTLVSLVRMSRNFVTKIYPSLCRTSPTSRLTVFPRSSSMKSSFFGHLLMKKLRGWLLWSANTGDALFFPARKRGPMSRFSLNPYLHQCQSNGAKRKMIWRELLLPEENLVRMTYGSRGRLTFRSPLRCTQTCCILTSTRISLDGRGL